MITTVVFDFDDTLCDYSGAKLRALEKVAALVAPHSASPAAFLEAYHRLEPALFRRFVDGEMPPQEYRRRRFSDVLETFGATAGDLHIELNHAYMKVANEEVVLFNDAVDVLRQLQGSGIVTALLTNGPADGQRKKLGHCKLGDLLTHVFVSEELGASKPAPQCFALVQQRLAAAPEGTVMVGDSLSDDVEAARAAGWRGVLLDRNDAHRDVQVDRISSLRELMTLLRISDQPNR